MKISFRIQDKHGGGDLRTTVKLGEIVSSDNRMAIITTGVGAKSTATIGSGTEGSIIKQTFVVPEDVTILTFDYNLVSEEPMEYVGSIYIIGEYSYIEEDKLFSFEYSNGTLGGISLKGVALDSDTPFPIN